MTFDEINTVLLTAGILLTVLMLKGLSNMSENTTTALTEIKAALDAEVAANTKFRADVTTALAALGNTNLTAEQQAIVDSIKAEAAQDTSATTAADAALTPTPPAA